MISPKTWTKKFIKHFTFFLFMKFLWSTTHFLRNCYCNKGSGELLKLWAILYSYCMAKTVADWLEKELSQKERKFLWYIELHWKKYCGRQFLFQEQWCADGTSLIESWDHLHSILERPLLILLHKVIWTKEASQQSYSANQNDSNKLFTNMWLNTLRK